MSSAKWLPFCLGLNVLKYVYDAAVYLNPITNTLRAAFFTPSSLHKPTRPDSYVKVGLISLMLFLTQFKCDGNFVLLLDIISQQTFANAATDVACAKICSFIRIWMRAKRKFYRIWIMIKRSLVMFPVLHLIKCHVYPANAWIIGKKLPYTVKHGPFSLIWVNFNPSMDK